MATGLATAAAVRDADRRAERDRDALAGRAAGALATEVETARNTVDDLRAFFESSQDVTTADFDRFTAAMPAREPALQALAWSEGAVEGPPAPALTAGDGPADPLGSAEAAAELAAARDGQETRLSAPIESSGGTTAVMVAPVYRAGARPTTPAERRAALRGFVSGVVSVPAFARAASAELPAGTDVAVEDAGPASARRARAGIDVAGRHLAVAVEGAGGPSRVVPVSVALGGLLLAAVVTLLFVESAGRERTARGELARLQMRHDLVLSSAGDGILSAGPDGRARFVNPAAAAMLGRSAELIARVGGEEFAMLLPDADADADVDEALRAAERIRRAIAATDFPAVGRITVSAGVCDLTHAEDADTLYRLADGALYWAKHRGRDRVVRWTPDAPEPLSTRGGRSGWTAGRRW